MSFQLNGLASRWSFGLRLERWVFAKAKGVPLVTIADLGLENVNRQLVND